MKLKMIFLLNLFIAGLVYALSIFEASNLRVAGIEWEIYNQEALKLYNEGKYQQSIEYVMKALKVAEKNVGRKHSDYAKSLNNLAFLYKVQGRYNEAEPLYK